MIGNGVKKIENRTRKKVSIIIISIFLILSIFSIYIYEKRNSNIGTTMEPIPESNVFEQLYSSSMLGKNMEFGIDVKMINDVLPDLPSYPQNFSIYSYDPPQLNSLEDAYKILKNHAFNISGYSVEKRSDLTDIGTFDFLFFNNTTSIGIARNGLISISYDISMFIDLNETLTKEETKNLTNRYLLAHNMTPTYEYIYSIRGNLMTNLGTNSSITTDYYVHISRVINSFIVMPGIYEYKIYLSIDAQKGLIREVRYHWPELNVYSEIDSSMQIPINNLLQDFISHKNSNTTNSNGTCNITMVNITYAKPLQTSLRNAKEDPLYYFCIPYIYVEWETGMTLLCPLEQE